MKKTKTLRGGQEEEEEETLARTLSSFSSSLPWLHEAPRRAEAWRVEGEDALEDWRRQRVMAELSVLHAGESNAVREIRRRLERRQNEEEREREELKLANASTLMSTLTLQPAPRRFDLLCSFAD